MTIALPSFRNSEPISFAAIPCLPLREFRTLLIAEVRSGHQLIALFGTPTENGGVQLIGVLADATSHTLTALSALVHDSYPCLTLECPQAHWFEREIAEQWNVRPEGHPWLKPIRFHSSYREASGTAAPKVGITDFFRVVGDEVHEVAVGPVHAGIIEPGHFRFQCHGERVLHLEISLGYQHRGVEAALVSGPHRRTIHMIEALAGDTSIGHAMAYCEALEGLAGSAVPARAQALRAIVLELERLANHTGDLGALAGDVGYLPTAAYCGRIRGDFLNLTAAICGSRFGRGMLRPGGVLFDLDFKLAAELSLWLDKALKDLAGAVQLMWDSPSVQDRFHDTGVLTSETCGALGLVGPLARACGMQRDIRRDFPTGIFGSIRIPVCTSDSGDVFGRAWVRWLEIQRSGIFVRDQLASLPAGPIGSSAGRLMPGQMLVSLVEGWRGAIVHTAITDRNGRFALYKVVDPSFRNWMGLAIAMRDQPISDFPLCNKSFNLSYCGHDL